MVNLLHYKMLDIIDGGGGGQVQGPSVQSARLQLEWDTLLS